MFKKVYLDVETRSELDLSEVGAVLYAEHPSTSILCIAWGLTPTTVRFVQGKHINERWMHDLYELACDPNVIFVCHNAFFEQQIWRAIMVEVYGFPPIPIQRWSCTMAKAYYYSIPGALDNACKALGLQYQKDKVGKKAMMKLSQPRKINTRNKDPWWTYETATSDYERLFSYCCDDVSATCGLDLALPDLPAKERKLWEIDQRINQTGVHLDMQAVRKAARIADEQNAAALVEFQSIVAGLRPSQRAKVQAWVEDQGFKLVNTQAYTCEKLIEEIKSKLGCVITPAVVSALKVIRALELMTSVGKSSLAKYPVMLRRADRFGVIHGLFQYSGAHTHRWTGRNPQFHNLARPAVGLDSDQIVDFFIKYELDDFEFFFPDVNTALSTGTRGVIIAPKGKKLRWSDLGQIESRLNAWFFGEDWKLVKFAAGVDMYCEMGRPIFGRDISKADYKERNACKVGDLSLGYQGGIAAYVKMGEGYNVDLSDVLPILWRSSTAFERSEAERHFHIYLANHKKSETKKPPVAKNIAYAANIIKQRWRDKHPKIVAGWDKLNRDACEAVLTGQPVRSFKALWFMHDVFLVCKLPDGTCMFYPFPKVVKKKRRGKDGEVQYELSYRKWDQGKWVRRTTYGGSLGENIIQAMGRVLLAAAIMRLEEKYPVCLHVHDEVCSEVPEDDESQDEYTAIVAHLDPWAAGLPMHVDTTEVKRYKK